MSSAFEAINPGVGFAEETLIHDRPVFKEVVGRIIQFGSEHRPKLDLMKLTAIGASLASASAVAIGAPAASASPEKNATVAASFTGCKLTSPTKKIVNKDSLIVTTTADCRYAGKKIPPKQLRWASIDVISSGIDINSSRPYICGDPTKPVKGKSNSLKLSPQGLNTVTFTVMTANKVGVKNGKGGNILKKSVTAKFDQGGKDELECGMVDMNHLPEIKNVCEWSIPSSTPPDPNDSNKCGLIMRDRAKDKSPVVVWRNKPTIEGSTIFAPDMLSPLGICHSAPITDKLQTTRLGEIVRSNTWDCGTDPNGLKISTENYLVSFLTTLKGDVCRLPDEEIPGNITAFSVKPNWGGYLSAAFVLYTYYGDQIPENRRASELATAYLRLPHENTGDGCAELGLKIIDHVASSQPSTG